MIGKQKPYRTKMFMAFCHEEMKPAYCAVCTEEPWTQLHHFGDDGGTGMKPNDLEVVRVCKGCHDEYGYKKLALILHKKVSATVSEWLLAKFYEDALKLNMAYVQYLEGKRERMGCAKKALEKSLMDHLKWTRKPVEERVRWLMEWADRRAVELFDAIES